MACIFSCLLRSEGICKARRVHNFVAEELILHFIYSFWFNHLNVLIHLPLKMLLGGVFSIGTLLFSKNPKEYFI